MHGSSSETGLGHRNPGRPATRRVGIAAESAEEAGAFRDGLSGNNCRDGPTGGFLLMGCARISPVRATGSPATGPPHQLWFLRQSPAGSRRVAPGAPRLWFMRQSPTGSGPVAPGAPPLWFTRQSPTRPGGVARNARSGARNHVAPTRQPANIAARPASTHPPARTAAPGGGSAAGSGSGSGRHFHHPRATAGHDLPQPSRTSSLMPGARRRARNAGESKFHPAGGPRDYFRS